MESRETARTSDQGVVQDGHLRIPVHYVDECAFLEMNGGVMRLIDSEAIASWLSVEIVFVRRLVDGGTRASVVACSFTHVGIDAPDDCGDHC